MENQREIAARSVSAVYANGRWFLIYAAMSAMAAYKGFGIAGALALMAAGRFVECGLAGVMRDGLETPGNRTIRDFGTNAVRYFPRALAAGLIIAAGCAAAVALSLFVLLMAGSYVPFLHISIRGFERVVWSPEVYVAVFVAVSAWTLMAVSLIIYRGSGVAGSLAGSWRVLAGNSGLIGIYAAVCAASLTALYAVPQEKTTLYQLAGAASNIVISCATACAYGALFIVFRDRDVQPTRADGLIKSGA